MATEDIWRAIGIVLTIVVLFWLHDQGEKAKARRDQMRRDGTAAVSTATKDIDLSPEGR